MSKRDYYEILGLSKGANQVDIKKAYKKLAIKWHPDKNPNNRDEAVEKFREITEAYQNLSNPDKRKIYDSYGFQGPKASSYSHFNFKEADDIFANFFSNNGFDHDEDDFFSSFFNRRKGKDGKPSSNKGGFGSFGGFGGFSGFSSGSMFDNDDFFKGMSGMTGGMGTSTSISTSTRTVNGKTVTTKKTTVVKQDGTKEVTEQVIDNGKKSSNTYSLGPGESQNSNKHRIKY